MAFKYFGERVPRKSRFLNKSQELGTEEKDIHYLLPNFFANGSLSLERSGIPIGIGR